jgi:TonB family protein
MKSAMLFMSFAVFPILVGAQGSRLLVPNTLDGLSYPAGMLARNQGGTVLVQLRIDEKGDVERLLDVQATNGLAELESAVRGVVRSWTFRRNTQRDCKVEGAEGVAQIEFAVKDGKPVITARGRPDVEAEMAAFRPKPSNLTIKDLVRTGYPLRARDAGLGAVVTVAVDVEESSGIPVAARVPNITFSRSPDYLEAANEFTEAARRALMGARFEQGQGRRGDIYQACVTLQYTPENKAASR